MAEPADGPNEVKLEDATPQQLADASKGLEVRYETLSKAMKNLRYAQDKFVGSRRALDDLPGKDGQPMLVPLTGSLYISGELETNGRVKVAIGASYFVEKDINGAKEFFDRKIKFLQQQMTEIQPVLMSTMTQKQMIDQRRQELMQLASQRQALSKE